MCRIVITILYLEGRPYQKAATDRVCHLRHRHKEVDLQGQRSANVYPGRGRISLYSYTAYIIFLIFFCQTDCPNDIYHSNGYLSHCKNNNCFCCEFARFFLQKYSICAIFEYILNDFLSDGSKVRWWSAVSRMLYSLKAHDVALTNRI